VPCGNNITEPGETSENINNYGGELINNNNNNNNNNTVIPLVQHQYVDDHATPPLLAPHTTPDYQTTQQSIQINSNQFKSNYIKSNQINI
jgi:hypothetical protein